MRFKAEPNLYVRFANKFVQRATGRKGISFDADGYFVTENELLCKVLSQHFEAIDGTSEPVAREPEESPVQGDSDPFRGMDDNAIRELGKRRKIKHWHIMSIEKLKKELEG